MEPAANLLAQAEALAETAPTWADLSNALFAPERGLLARALPTPAARAAFARTDEYRRIRQLVTRAMGDGNLVPGGTPAGDHSLVIPLPAGVRATLEHEAATEGVGLAQWMLTKLSLPAGAAR